MQEGKNSLIFKDSSTAVFRVEKEGIFRLRGVYEFKVVVCNH